MKIYTKTGDSGKTGLFGGERVDKDHVRVAAYGTIDELNAFLGVLVCSVQKDMGFASNHQDLVGHLLAIQSQLFTLGSELASSTPQVAQSLTKITTLEDVTELEGWIDRMNEVLPALSQFILPGGGEMATNAHVCRTVCRRAEREMVKISECPPIHTKYINRLSDYFFVLARFLTIAHGVEEKTWHS